MATWVHDKFGVVADANGELKDLPRFALGVTLLRVLGIVSLLAAHALAAPDTLVVCPTELRAALAPWESYRRGQSHELEIIGSPATSDELHAAIRRAAGGGHLKFVVLVGDVPAIPTEYADAIINMRWGSEPTIATDQLYADVDGDAVPDVAVGRIPVDTIPELHAVVRKVIQYEQNSDHGTWRRQLDVVAGTGGFGPLTDTLIETAGRSIFQQVVPANFRVRQLPADPDATCAQISAGSFAWIYLGHGLPSMLDVARTARGDRPILAVGDVPRLRCGANRPIAVLIACYTGAIDARQDCLAEELMLNPLGPVAAIAATRVTMPYGNSVLGCELLRAALADHPATLGEVWTQAQRKTLAAAPSDDSLRESLDALARGVSPPPVDLAGERREHVLMYQLLGDPLLQLDFPPAEPRPPGRVALVPDERTQE